MFKKTLIASAIATAAVLSSGSVLAESGEGFVDGASMDLGFMYYGRQRNAEGDMYTNTDGDVVANDNRDIKVHALGMNANLKSGWYDGWLAVDGSILRPTLTCWVAMVTASQKYSSTTTTLPGMRVAPVVLVSSVPA